MKLNDDIAKLVFEMEYLIGNQCYNPHSLNGYTGEEGRSFRYPVYIYPTKESTEPRKSSYKISNSPYGEPIQPEMIRSMKYKMGANHLYIGKGILKVLELLEERYGLDFNTLEKDYKKQNK